MKSCLFCFFLLIFALNGNVVLAAPQASELPECIVVSHCVREDWKVSDVPQLFSEAVGVISRTPRTKIVELNDSFLHAEAQTKWMKYTDDLLLKALPERGIIQIRSESRVGLGDNGVNQRRINELANRLNLN